MDYPICLLETFVLDWLVADRASVGLLSAVDRRFGGLIHAAFMSESIVKTVDIREEEVQAFVDVFLLF